MTGDTKLFGIAIKEMVMPVVIAVLTALVLAIGVGSLAYAKSYVNQQDKLIIDKLDEYLKVIQGPFLTISEWKLASAEEKEIDLESDIKFLEWKMEEGTATSEDKFWLKQKQIELEKIQGFILKLMTNRPVA